MAYRPLKGTLGWFDLGVEGLLVRLIEGPICLVKGHPSKILSQEGVLELPGPPWTTSSR